MRQHFPNNVEARKSSTPFLDKKIRNLQCNSPYSDRFKKSANVGKSAKKVPPKWDDETRERALAEWDYKKRVEQQLRNFYVNQQLQVAEMEMQSKLQEESTQDGSQRKLKHQLWLQNKA